MSFKDWLAENQKELVQVYKSLLQGVPQNPKHHPEGDVLTHVRLVRKAIPRAISELKRIQVDDSHPLSDVLANLDFNLSPEEEKIIKIAAWLHDIGKHSATLIGDKHWTQGGEGKITSIGHQEPPHYLPQIEKLKQVAPKDLLDFYLDHMEIINWLIEHHMDLMSTLPKKFIREYFDGKRLKNDPKVKLLLILMWADKIGRMPEEVIIRGLKKNEKNLLDSAKRGEKLKQNIEKGKSSKSFTGTPEEFVKLLKSRNVPSKNILFALKNKFPHLSDEECNELLEHRSLYNENEQSVTLLKVNIPVPKYAYIIAEALTKNHPETEVYVVGGAVRDFLFGRKPKDFDLATNITEEDIINRTTQAGLHPKQKESETFGVVFVTVPGFKEPIEVAPFRSDEGIADGRKPQSVSFHASIEEDAKRRDFTINNLYYDFGYGKYGKGYVVDLNENGQGIKDIQNKVVRPVGNPLHRFIEDRLRILRLVRFFSRFNTDNILRYLDESTLDAIEKLKDLRSSVHINGVTLLPISAERIQEEFVKGILQSKNTSSYIQNYHRLGMLETVIFPGLKVNVLGIDRLENNKNINVIFAWLLKDNSDVQQKLNQLKYPRNLYKRVQFLIDAMKLSPENVYQIIKKKQSLLLPASHSPVANELNKKIYASISNELNQLAKMTGDIQLMKIIAHFAGEWDESAKDWKRRPYEPPKISGGELQKMGYRGPEIGKEIQKRISSHYTQELEKSNKETMDDEHRDND